MYIFKRSARRCSAYSPLAAFGSTVCGTSALACALRFNVGEPRDVDEFLDVLFNCLDEALKSSLVKDLKSLVPDYFKSEYVFTQTCSACGAVHSTENCESTLVRLSALHRTLEDAILAYFDYKTGVQLTCGHCSHQSLHQRRGVFRQLPPVLWLGMDRARESRESAVSMRQSGAVSVTHVQKPGTPAVGTVTRGGALGAASRCRMLVGTNMTSSFLNLVRNMTSG